MSKNSSIPALTLASLPSKPLQYAGSISLRNDTVGRSVLRSILTFVKGPDIKKQEKRVCHAVTMHILTKDYSNFIIYTVWFSFLSLKIWFVVGSNFLLVQFDAYLAKQTFISFSILLPLLLNDVLFSLFLFSLSIITPSQATCNL